MQRTNLGDPDFVHDVQGYEAEMLHVSSAAAKRGKINDNHTLNVSAYDPKGLEVQDT